MKVKYILEYPMNCSPLILYPLLSSPGGLSEWFSDNVNIENKFFVFYWEGTGQRAELLHSKENVFIRFHWEDDLKEPTYFEFRIITDELTNDTALFITDFEEETEKKGAIELWNYQVSRLRQCVGV
jgi:hypothetical protein